ncbi:hypothetical protein [Hymenobacter lapidiphilus]|uniref:Uncharacterized protein n=1 Tax=Hymenobacter lapidiphilus TaxID=2608003 RepID=A0A7Y7PPF7_9BACT|nr:hypothetical protein [Hymenobacter lapidiphilus]NVO31568.1 hypothetical protein [Hymenobacter lapidiphilus]
MRTLFCLLLTAMTLLGASRAQAQQPPAAVADSAAVQAVPPALGTATDVIVRINGDELPARVLGVTPQVVRYLPLPATGAPPIAPDTLQLAVADVFMIRYANGTRGLFRSAKGFASEVSSLVGLSAAQRYELGQQDSRRYYQPAKGVFWGTFASTAAAGPAGLVVGSAVAFSSPSHFGLKAPAPVLLQDPDYYKGYYRQAKSRKAGKAVLGVGLGAASLMLVLAVVSSTMLSGSFLNMY